LGHRPAPELWHPKCPGSRAFTALASVIETCRQRGLSPWTYIAEVLRERRRGNPAPPLPAAVAA
jgi:transposase